MDKNLNEQRSIKRLSQMIDYYDYIIECAIKRRFKSYSNQYINLSFLILSNDIREIAKSILILYQNESRIGIDSLNRVAFEKFLFLLVVIKSNGKAKAFYLKQHIRQYEHLEKLLHDKTYISSFLKLTGKDAKSTRSFLKDKYPNFKTSIVELFELYYECYDYVIEDTQKFRHKWYNFNGETNSISKLAYELGLSEEYNVIYDLQSSEVHSLSLSKYYKRLEENGKAYFGILKEKDIEYELSGILFITAKLFDVLKILFELYSIPKREKDTFYTIMQSTIDYSRHIKSQ